MTFPARLHVLLARDAPIGLVIRRGPAEHVSTLKWDRAKGKVELGQWLKGRIYERRCDLSPCGRYFLYFARGKGHHPETKGTWTALSIAPYLKAIKIWGKGDCWQGGGLFTGRRQYWLNGCGHFLVRNESEFEIDPAFDPLVSYGGECSSVYYLRLQRDGWRLVDRIGVQFDSATVFEKELPEGWTLRKYAHEQVGPEAGKGCYWDEHELEHEGSRQLHPGWEWVEWVDDALVYSERGCLWRTQPGAEPALIHDFNGAQFERLVAPY